MVKQKYFILIGFLIFAAHSSCAQDDHGSTHGTLITVMGNKQGIVVVADSMQSTFDTTGHPQPMPTVPAQKLMQYDDRTVCATAGLLSYRATRKYKPDPLILPQLNLQVLGIVQAYRDAAKQPGKSQSMSDALQGLSGALRGRFSTLAELDSYLGHEAAEIDFNFQLRLRLAGFDTDGEPKIGSLDLTITLQRWPDGQMHWAPQEMEKPKVEVVHDALLIRSSGIDQTEKEMLAHPERFGIFTIMQDYISAMQKDEGASLSTEYMKKLGHLFKVQTAYGQPAVGGPDQVATIVKGRQPELEGLDSFPPIEHAIQFTHFICSPGVVLSGNFNAILTGTRPIIFQSCTFDRYTIELGYSLFLHCTFRNSELIYDGGDVLFDDDNVIEGNSRIDLRQHSGRRPDIANRLASKFDFFHGGSAFPDPSTFIRRPPFVNP
jgi:hypothetical protein